MIKPLQVILPELFFFYSFAGQTQIINTKVLPSTSLGANVSLLSDFIGASVQLNAPLVQNEKSRWFVIYWFERIEKDDIIAAKDNVFVEQYKLSLNTVSLGVARYATQKTSLQYYLSLRMAYSLPEETTNRNEFKDTQLGSVVFGGGVELRISDRLFYHNGVEIGYRHWYGEKIDEIYKPEPVFGQLNFGVKYYIKKRVTSFKG